MGEIVVLQTHITNYLKTKDIYAGYRASGYSKKYYEEHEDEIKLCKASKRAFDELLPSDTSGKTADSHRKQLPSLKSLRAPYAELLAAKKAAYPEYYQAKDEYREFLTYQANLAGLFGIDNVRNESLKGVPAGRKISARQDERSRLPARSVRSLCATGTRSPPKMKSSFIWGLGNLPNKQKQKVPPTGGIFLFGPLYVQRHCLHKK